MKNLIKSILYEVTRSKLLLITYSFMIALMILLGLINAPDSSTSGMYITDSSLPYTFPLFVIALTVGMVICPDYRDKVGNYEILSGHSRISVYFSRVLCAVIPGAFLAYFLTFLPMITGIIFCGWGDRLVFTDVLSRQLLFIFPFIRLAAFTACLAYMIKNEYVLMSIGIIYSFGSLFLTSIFDKVSSNVFISIYNLKYLMSYDVWSIYNLSPTKGIVKYASATGSIDTKMIFSTIAASCVMTLIYIIIGYALFRRSEMN